MRNSEALAVMVGTCILLGIGRSVAAPKLANSYHENALVEGELARQRQESVAELSVHDACGGQLLDELRATAINQYGFVIAYSDSFAIDSMRDYSTAVRWHKGQRSMIVEANNVRRDALRIAELSDDLDSLITRLGASDADDSVATQFAQYVQDCRASEGHEYLDVLEQQDY